MYVTTQKDRGLDLMNYGENCTDRACGRHSGACAQVEGLRSNVRARTST